MEIDFDSPVDELKKNKKGYYFSEVPIGLLLDTRISAGAVRQYALYHSYCKDKKINEMKSETFVGQTRIAKNLNCSVKAVKKRQKELEHAGWIFVKRRAYKKARTNIIRLNPHIIENKPINKPLIGNVQVTS